MRSPRDHRTESDIPARIRELLDEGDQHPSLEEIAALLEGGADSPEGRGHREHLGRCRRCFARYAELARAQLEWAFDPRRSGVPEDLRRAAHDLPASPRVAKTAARKAAGRPPVGLAASGALAAAACLAIVLGLPWLREPASGIDARERQALRSALSAVLPPGWVMSEARGGVEPAPVFRAAEPRLPQGFESTLEGLIERYENPRTRSEEGAFWLVAACLADRDPEAASAFLGEARARYPGSRRLALLEAMIDYGQSRLDRAEASLRALAGDAPRDPTVLIDLAILLEEVGRIEEARSLLSEARGLLPKDDPLRRHVEARLAALWEER